MSFLDGEPFVVDAGITQSHARYKRMLICAWCGRDLKVGDVARFVMTNTSEPATVGLQGNPFVCSSCDGPRDQILAELRRTLSDFASPRFRWFRGWLESNAEARGEQRADNARDRDGEDRS